MNAEKWYETYLQPFFNDETLRTRIDECGGLDGWVLDGVLAVKQIDGQEATDSQCLQMVGLLINEWANAQKRGF